MCDDDTTTQQREITCDDDDRLTRELPVFHTPEYHVRSLTTNDMYIPGTIYFVTRYHGTRYEYLNEMPLPTSTTWEEDVPPHRVPLDPQRHLAPPAPKVSCCVLQNT